jgi:D-xylose transport system permease protein
VDRTRVRTWRSSGSGPADVHVFVLAVVAANYALTRTRWGRHMFAVRGGVEAARPAGINVDRVYTSAFVLTGTLAALGGVLMAARLASASQSAGTGDVNLNAIAAAVIGGASLFGAGARLIRRCWESL